MADAAPTYSGGAAQVSLSAAIPEDVLDLARKYGLKREASLAARGVEGFRAAFNDAFIEHDREAIEASRQHVRAHGTPVGQFGFIVRETE